MLPKKALVLLGLGLLIAVFLVACGTKATSTPEAPTAAPAATLEVPFSDAFLGSAHADAKALAFNDWNTPEQPGAAAAVPATCAKCHTSAGFQQFAATGKVTDDVPAPAGTLACVTCHSPAAIALTSVTFPSGKLLENVGSDARCMSCHQGRESKVSVDKKIADFNVTDMDAVVKPKTDANGKTTNFGFVNVHYLAAAGTLYGSQAETGYQYDGKSYDPKFQHVEGYTSCTSCHDQHSLQVRVDKCATCHEGVKTVDDLKNNREPSSSADYNGNGDTKEGIYYELKGLQETLMGSLQMYAKEVTGTGIAYDPAAYPYWFADADGDGKPDQKDGKPVVFTTWTARLLKAAYNYQLSIKDPGAYAHNAKYVIELLYDSTDDLNGKISKPVDMTKLNRDDAGHFAGDAMAFRDWDGEGAVPATCARCHSATGLPQFIENNGTLGMTKTGSLLVTGIVAQPPANGLACSTCHDEKNWPNRIPVTNVTFPSGAVLTFSTEKDDQGNLKPVASNLCIECHQGRESTVSVDRYLTGKPDDTADPKIGFKNVHYLAAGATLFGDAAKGAYQYPDQTYLGPNTTHPLSKCTDCHEPHQGVVKVEACKTCHTSVEKAGDVEKIRMSTDTTDWNGNGDLTEPVNTEIAGFQQALYAALQAYAEKNGTPIVYDAASYPYFFVDMNKDGKADTTDKGAVSYNAWTPRLLRAAYNYQFSIKDPGAFAHNPKYIMQVLYDSTKDLGGDVSKLTRP